MRTEMTPRRPVDHFAQPAQHGSALSITKAAINLRSLSVDPCTPSDNPGASILRRPVLVLHLVHLVALYLWQVSKVRQSIAKTDLDRGGQGKSLSFCTPH